MYKVIAVDDEPWSLMGIKKIFDWGKYGFELCFSTTEPEIAFEMIVKERPDVVFTDVNMPEISGLQLMRMVRERKIDAEFVIISGYADFEYAREGIQYNLSSYCLKPVAKNDADNLLERLRKKLDEKYGVHTEVYAPETIANATFRKMLEFINDNYMDKLTLSYVAKKFKYNPTYVCNLFNKYLNCSFTDYLAELRIVKAKQLLVEQELSLEQIAASLSYDYYYFVKQFKKHTGLTPKEYQRTKL